MYMNRQSLGWDNLPKRLYYFNCGKTVCFTKLSLSLALSPPLCRVSFICFHHRARGCVNCFCHHLPTSVQLCKYSALGWIKAYTLCPFQKYASLLSWRRLTSSVQKSQRTWKTHTEVELFVRLSIRLALSPAPRSVGSFWSRTIPKKGAWTKTWTYWLWRRFDKCYGSVMTSWKTWKMTKAKGHELTRTDLLIPVFVSYKRNRTFVTPEVNTWTNCNMQIHFWTTGLKTRN